MVSGTRLEAQGDKVQNTSWLHLAKYPRVEDLSSETEATAQLFRATLSKSSPEQPLSLSITCSL